MSATTTHTPEGTADTLPLSQVAAVGVGNALEFYDFLSFSFFALQIGHTFFPASQTSHGRWAGWCWGPMGTGWGASPP